MHEPTIGPLSRSRARWDVALAAACLVATLIVNLSGVESVAQNRDHDAMTVMLTVLAVAVLALRHRFPLQVLAVTLLAIVGLVAIRGTVGLATVGPFIAFYTAVAIGSQRIARAAVGLVVATLAVTFVLRPVDLSQEGALVNIMVLVAAYVVATGTRTRREKATTDVRAAEQRAELERERAQVERERSARTASEERLRITRELHDIIGHALSVMVVQAGVAERFLDTRPEEARSAVAEIGQTGRRSLGEMRQLLGILREGDGELDSADGEGESSSHGPAPTLHDVEALAARIRVAGLPVVVTVWGERPDVPAGVDLAAYRVVQESLTNCLRHSGAARATVAVTYAPTAVDVEVLDTGRTSGGGSDAASSAGTTGHGITGMRERVAIHGGELSAGPGVDGGFRVHARLPLVPLALASPSEVAPA